MKKVKDQLRGDYIHLSDLEVEVIDTPEVQRLRRIKQLGYSSLVYPGATHTRFSHTLGVLLVTKQFIESMDIEDPTARRLKLAALLHDTGHGPFSHASERLSDVPDHEQFSCNIVENLGDRGVLRDEDVEPVKQFIKGERSPHVVSGDVDADRIDYLVRDAFYTGNKNGVIEEETIIEGATLHNGELVFDKTAISALCGIPQARQTMHTAVYMHPTVRIAERMLVESMEYSSIPNREIFTYDDYTLHGELLNDDNSTASELYDRLINRDLYKTAYTIRGIEDQDISEINPDQFEQEIVDSIEEVEDHEVFVDVYPATPSHLTIDVLIDGEKYPFQDVVQGIGESNSYNIALAVYTPDELTGDVRDVAENLMRSK